MDVDGFDGGVAPIAAAIGEPARARMLYCLADGHARTSTELAMIAEISPSTASAHLQRLTAQQLVQVFAQGKHRYYSLAGPDVAAALEALSVLAGGSRKPFVPNTPGGLRAARTCYDHIAGALGVGLHDRLMALDWIERAPGERDNYRIGRAGAAGFAGLGIDIAEWASNRRRLAYACLDWSERRPHVGGTIGAALLKIALKRRWVAEELDSRALRVTALGRREMAARFELD
jgi:DNA-binding transcriptional ArsR family regulator